MLLKFKIFPTEILSCTFFTFLHQFLLSCTNLTFLHYFFLKIVGKLNPCMDSKVKSAVGPPECKLPLILYEYGARVQKLVIFKREDPKIVQKSTTFFKN